jgi:hypothetical protein
MKQKRWAISVTILFLLFTYIIFQATPAEAGPSLQIPTGTILTVTGTPKGPVVTVRLDLDLPSVNIRSGPLTTYQTVGVLLVGQSAPALGRSPGGDWIEIEYPGAPGGVAWVYAPNVNVSLGDLKIVQPPPSPTPQYTVTIDPTMAAQFVVTIAATRIASFTPPPPLTIPTFVAVNSTTGKFGVPPGMIIIGLAAVGLFLGIFSLTQGR